MHIMSTNFTKTLVWKYDYDAKLWRHKQRTPNTNDHHMPLNETTPYEKFLRTPLNLSNHEEEWLILAYYLSTCLSRSFVLTRRCTLSWVTKILMWAISNVHADRLWRGGRRFPTPDVKHDGHPTERFLGFIKNVGHKAEGMSNAVTEMLEKHDIDISLQDKERILW